MAVKVGQVVVDFLLNTAKFESGIKKATRSLNSMGRDFKKAGQAMTYGITLPMIAAGVAIGKVANDIDVGMKTIRAGTGATGAALQALGKNMQNVMKQVPNDVAQVSTAIADLNTRLGLTGKPLEKMSMQILNLARITKSEVGSLVSASTRLFGDWSVATDKQANTLDYLFKVSQNTGIAVQRLMEVTVQYGAPLRALGFNFEQAAVAMGKWEKEGVNMETTLSGLRYALGQFARLGKDPVESLKAIQNQIISARTEADATAIAFKIFGQRAAVDLSRAIIEGRFNFEDLIKIINSSSETINKAAKETLTFSDKLGLMRNRVSLAAQPLGSSLLKAFDSLIPYLEKAISAFGSLIESFTNLPGPAKAVIVSIGGITAATGPALWAFGSMATGVASLLPLMTKLSKAIKSSTFLFGPWGIAIAAATVGVITFREEIADAVVWLTDLIGLTDSAPKVINESEKAFEGIAEKLKISVNTLKSYQAENQNALSALGKHRNEVQALQKDLRLGNISQTEYDLGLRTIIESTQKGSETLRKLLGTVNDLTTTFDANADKMARLTEQAYSLTHPMSALTKEIYELNKAGARMDSLIMINTENIIQAAVRQKELFGALNETEAELLDHALLFKYITESTEAANHAIFKYKLNLNDLKMPEDLGPIPGLPQKDLDKLALPVDDAIRRWSATTTEEMNSMGQAISTTLTNSTQDFARWATKNLGIIKGFASTALAAIMEGFFNPIYKMLTGIGNAFGNWLFGNIGGALFGTKPGFSNVFGSAAIGVAGKGLLSGAAATTASSAGAMLGPGLAGASPVVVGGGSVVAGTKGMTMAGLGKGILGAFGLGSLPATAAIPLVGGLAMAGTYGISKLIGAIKGKSTYQAFADETRRDFGVNIGLGPIKAFLDQMGISESQAWKIRGQLMLSPQYQAFLMSMGYNPQNKRADLANQYASAQQGRWGPWNEWFLNQYANEEPGTFKGIEDWFDKLTIPNAFYPANSNQSSQPVSVRNGDMNLTFVIHSKDAGDYERMTKERIIPIIMREIDKGNTGLRDSIAKTIRITAGAY